ncbi:hypothetical protein Hdeb2414_s0001g00014661 [Helianthus debilis subsp. tardiflorus]
MVYYHRHTFNLILTLTLIYTFVISIILSTTDPNVLNQLRKGLDLSHSNFSPPLLKYNPSMKLVLSGNQLFQSSSSKIPPKPSSHSGSQPDNIGQLSHLITPSIGDSRVGGVPTIQLKKKPNVVLTLTPVAFFADLALLTIPLGLYLCKLKKANSSEQPSSLVIHLLDLSYSDNTVRISVANDTQMHASVFSGSCVSPVIKFGNTIISVHVLNNATKTSQKKASPGMVDSGSFTSLGTHCFPSSV